MPSSTCRRCAGRWTRPSRRSSGRVGWPEPTTALLRRPWGLPSRTCRDRSGSSTVAPTGRRRCRAHASSLRSCRPRTCGVLRGTGHLLGLTHASKILTDLTGPGTPRPRGQRLTGGLVRREAVTVSTVSAEDWGSASRAAPQTAVSVAMSTSGPPPAPGGRRAGRSDPPGEVVTAPVHGKPFDGVPKHRARHAPVARRDEDLRPGGVPVRHPPQHPSHSLLHQVGGVVEQPGPRPDRRGVPRQARPMPPVET